MTLGRFPKGSLQIILNGVSREKFSGLPDTKLMTQIGLEPEALILICVARLEEIKGQDIPIRTARNLERFGLAEGLQSLSSIRLLDPLNYTSFMNLVFHASIVITDSGGIQEETTYLGIPCLTLRPNTERPITIEQGTNRLCTPDNLESRFQSVFTQKFPKGKIPDMWDGCTAKRVVDSLKLFFNIQRN